MILYESFRDELVEQLAETDPVVFVRGCGKSKSDILTDKDIIGQMWVVYQKDIEEYEMGAPEAFRAALEDVLGIPAEDKEGNMTIYIVRRYTNNLPAHEYGVSDSYTMVGTFSSMEKAQEIKAQVEQEALAEQETFKKEIQQIHEVRRSNWEKWEPQTPFPEEEDLRELMQNVPASPVVDIIEVELDKRYAVGEEPELGGGFYIE